MTQRLVQVSKQLRATAETFIREYVQSWDNVTTDEPKDQNCTWAVLKDAERRYALGQGAIELAEHYPTMAALVSFAETVIEAVDLPRSTKEQQAIALGAVIQRIAYAPTIEERAAEPEQTHPTTGTLQ